MRLRHFLGAVAAGVWSKDRRPLIDQFREIYGDVCQVPQELRSSGPMGSRGGRGCTEQNRPTDTHTNDVYNRHGNERLTRVRTDFRRYFPFWDTSR